VNLIGLTIMVLMRRMVAAVRGKQPADAHNQSMIVWNESKASHSPLYILLIIRLSRLQARQWSV